MTVDEEDPPDWKKQGLVRFHNVDDFFKHKCGLSYKSEHIGEHSKVKTFEEVIKENKGEYFLLEVVNGTKLSEHKGEYAIGILSGDICYSIDGKRNGTAFEAQSDIPGFFQYFYKKEIILRTEKRNYTTGGTLGELTLQKIREDPALSVEDILNGTTRCYFADGCWEKGHWKKYYGKKRLKNGRKGNPYGVTAATKRMARLFSMNIKHIVPFLECNLTESEWHYKEANQTS